jgi:hypothetical protein
VTPTAEQAAIADAVRSGEPCQVRAFAGTGKTETLRFSTTGLNGRRVLYIAFNRSVATEARQRFPVSVDCRTYHSLAYAAEGVPFARRLVGNLWALQALLPTTTARQLADLGGLTPYGAFALVAETLNAFLHSPDTVVSPDHVPRPALNALPSSKRVALIPPTVAAATELWDRISDPTGDTPATHDVYLKRWQLTRPQLPYDVILLDEAQDADPVLLEVLRHQRSAQLVVVGDPYQAIYGWRGSRDALAGWRHRILPLTTSWRFGPALAERANRVLGLLGGRHQITGGGPGAPRPGPRAVIARTNAALVREAATLLTAGSQRVAVLGGAAPLARLLTEGYVLRQGRPVRHPDLVWFRTWAAVREAADTTVGATLSPLVTLVEQHGDAVPQLAHRLEHGTVPEADATVVLTTAHKAKGREWTHVTCLDDFVWPRRREEREEAHLIYVALTRGRETCDAPALDHLLEQARPLDPDPSILRPRTR